MSSFSLEGINTLNRLMDRNRLATTRITEIAVAHGVGDAVLGGLGSIIPGMGPVALVSAMSLQLPVYQALVNDLGRIYSTTPDKFNTYQVIEGAAIGAAGMLAAEFGLDFLREIAPGILMEGGLGIVASFIPVVSIYAGVALDFAIAATMTWRVGTMASIYFQNGHRWVGGRKRTYKIAKKLTGRLSPTTTDRVNLDSISAKVPEVSESQVETAMGLIRMLRKMQPNATDEFLRETMAAQGLPPAPIKEALRRMRSSKD